MKRFKTGLFAILLLSLIPAVPEAQMDPSLFPRLRWTQLVPSRLAGLRWRSLVALRGGRSQAGAGSAARPFEYYFGATGGGVWKTTDGGLTWRPVTDKQIKSSSVGASDSAPSSPGAGQA